MVRVKINAGVAEEISYTITPQRISGSFTGVTGVTGQDGIAYALLPPSVHPYLVEFAEKHGVNLPKKAFYFLVFDGLDSMDSSWSELHNITYDPYSPTGNTLYKYLKILAETNAKYEEAVALITKIKEESSGSGVSIQQSVLNNWNTKLNNQFELLKEVVDSISSIRDNLLQEMEELTKTFHNSIDTASDIITDLGSRLSANELGMLNLNGHYLWFDDNDILRWKKGKPSDMFDGKAIN